MSNPNPNISVTVQATFTIEMTHRSSWQPSESGAHLFEVGARECEQALQNLFIEQRTKGNSFRIIRTETTSVVASKQRV